MNGASPVRVVELADPWTRAAGRILAQLGHDVLLVERQGGEPDRAGLEFAHWHAGKGSVYLDRVGPLLATADVLLTGPSAPDLPAAPASVVHVSITPFGRTGPRRDWSGTDLTVAAAGGMLAQVGRPDGPPLLLAGSQAEQLAGVNGALAALLGLWARQRTGHGQHADVSAQECVAASLEAGALLYLHEDRTRARTGRKHPLAPHLLFEAADGLVAAGLAHPRLWPTIVGLLADNGAADDLADPQWNDLTVRARGVGHIFDVLQAFIGTRTKEAVATAAQKLRLPWAAVDSPAEVLDNPQLAARSFFVSVTWSGGTHRDAGPAFAPAAGIRRTLAVPAPDSAAAGPAPTPAHRGAAPPPLPDGSPALSGLRVLDLTWVLAGPYATRILADHGADVLKIESSARPDPTRFVPFMHLSRGSKDDPDTSGYFNNMNRNKRSVALDLRDPRGVDVLRRLVPTCDVVIENFSAGVMTRLGVGYEAMRELRPDIIYVSMSGMGHTGPWRDWVGYADAVTAVSGLTGLTGWSASDVLGVPYGHSDVVAGHHAALAVLDALAHRHATGHGRHVDLAQLEAITSHLGHAVLASAAGQPVEPRGNTHPRWAPHGLYPCLGVDRWCAIAVRDDAQWQALARLAGRADLAGDPRYATAAGRRGNSGMLDAALSAWTRLLPAPQLAQRLQAHGIPAAPVQDGRDLVEHDPQLADRGFYVLARHSVAGEFPHEGVPIRLSATPGSVRTAAPSLGVDTVAVLRADLGMSDVDIAGLAAGGVLA